MRLRYSSSAWLNVLFGLVLMAVSNFVLLRQHNLGAEEALQAKAEQMLLSIEEVQSKLDSLIDIPLSFDGANSESDIQSEAACGRSVGGWTAWGRQFTPPRRAAW